MELSTKEVKTTWSQLRWEIGAAMWRRIVAGKTRLDFARHGEEGPILEIISREQYHVTVSITGTEEQVKEMENDLLRTYNGKAERDFFQNDITTHAETMIRVAKETQEKAEYLQKQAEWILRTYQELNDARGGA